MWPTRGRLFFPQRRELPWALVARKDSPVISVRRSTVVRVGIAALVVLALGAGIAVGLTVGSKSSPPATKSTEGSVSTTRGPTSKSTTSTSASTATTVAPLPAVLSCGPGSTPHVRPAKLTIGCAFGLVTVTAISWTLWAAATGGQGTGTLNVNNCQPDCATGKSRSTPAIVVVFGAENGIFQDVSITPTRGVSTPSTTSSTAGTAPLPTTTTTTGGPAPVAASQPGSGWGGE